MVREYSLDELFPSHAIVELKPIKMGLAEATTTMTSFRGQTLRVVLGVEKQPYFILADGHRIATICIENDKEGEPVAVTRNAKPQKANSI